MKHLLHRKAYMQKCLTQLSFSFLLSIQLLYSDAQAPQQDLYLNNEIKFERLGLEQGLNNYINTLMQDRKGYMWFGTSEDGLYKYDGHTFTHYKRNPRDTNSLADNSVSALYEDRNGIIWVGFGAGGGVNSFNPQTGHWKRYKHDPKNPTSLTGGSIHTIQSDQHGLIWFGSLNGGVCRFNPKTGTFKTYKNNPGDKSSISNNRVPVLFIDKAGQLWVGTNTGLDLYDPNTESFQHITGETGAIATRGDNAKSNFSLQYITGSVTDSILLRQTEVHNIIQDDKGLLWLCTLGKGIFVLDPITKKFVAHLKHNPRLPGSLSHDYVVCLTQDKTGNYWMQTQTGMNKLDAQTGRFSIYQQEQYLPIRWDVHTAITDKNGVVWFGTMTKGALYFTPHSRIFYRFLKDSKSSFGISANEVRSIFKGSDEQIYLTTTYSLLRFNPAKKEFSLVYQSKKEKGEQDPVPFLTAFEEKPGVFWIGTWGKGIIEYNTTTKKETYIQHNKQDSGSLANNVVYALLRDRKGVVWAGTENGHLQQYDAALKKFSYYPYRTNEQRTQFSEEGFSFLFEDKKGTLWVSVKAGFIGTGGGGLYQINREKGTIYYGQKGAKHNSLSSDAISCIYEDEKGTIWLGTNGGGLNKLDPNTGTVSFYTEENGLQSNKIVGLAGDKNGNLWISSPKGITFFNTHTLKKNWFDVSDGLGGTPSGRVKIGTGAEYSSFKDDDGTIYFGSDNGITVFHPDHVYLNSSKPPVAITQIKAFDQVIPINEQGIVLNYNQNFFEFEFAALSYLSSNKNQYAYMLEGVDKDWVYSGTRRIATYTDVRPGKYIFRAKGSNNDGVWNEQGIAIPVTVLPPWWFTWWAYVIYAILVIGSIWAFIHYRSRSLVRQKRELEHQVAARTTEVIHQKEELQFTIQNLKATQSQLIQKEKMASLGELTAGIAHEIQNPLNFVNNFSELSTELLDEMQAELKEGNTSEALVIATDVKQNLSKINHHGKRADAIVKNMLQHSRKSSGSKEPTDLNALVDEYLRLSYHGLRAKFKNFNAILETHYDPSVGSVNIISQDIGRVFLNLFNNAFYSVSKKKAEIGKEYEPTVIVRTVNNKNTIEVCVKDNGIGIPQNVLDKIYQPFFTTKPTGEGTGLGLSLSYDIVKAHGGELKVNTIEGKGAEFIVELQAYS